MRGLVVNIDKSIAIKEMPMPKYNEYQALVKIKSGGLCGTDIKIIHGTLEGFTDYPTILGHESIGEIVETGAKVQSFKKGDLVALPLMTEKCGEYFSTFGALLNIFVLLKKKFAFKISCFINMFSATESVGIWLSS